MTTIQPKDIYKIIPDYPDYGADSVGNIYSLKYNKLRVLKPHKSKLGYMFVSVCKDNVTYNRLVHRLVVMAHTGEITGNLQVNHINGVKTDNRLENLELCTAAENISHAHKIKLITNRGAGHYNTRMVDDDVRNILRLYSIGELTKVAIGKLYGLTGETIAGIVSGKSWKHLHGEIL